MKLGNVEAQAMLIERHRMAFDDLRIESWEIRTLLPPRSHPREEPRAPRLAFSCV